MLYGLRALQEPHILGLLNIRGGQQTNVDQSVIGGRMLLSTLIVAVCSESCRVHMELVIVLALTSLHSNIESCVV